MLESQVSVGLASERHKDKETVNEQEARAKTMRSVWEPSGPAHFLLVPKMYDGLGVQANMVAVLAS